MRRATAANTALTSADALAEAADILHRRTTCRPEDPDLHLFPTVEDTANATSWDAYLFAVIGYVSRHRQVPIPVRAADVASQARIINYLHTVLDRRLLAALTLGRRDYAMSWAELAEPLGVASRQGAEQTWQRLRNALQPGGGRRSEVAGRADETLARRPNPSPLPDTTTRQLIALAGELVACANRLPAELASDVDNVRYALTPTATLAAARMLLAELGAVTDTLPADVAGLLRRGQALIGQS